jgi:outer membrane protein OmpA-like peptidoglycan-associated protein
MSSNIQQFELAKSARIEHRSNFLTGTVTDKQSGKPLEAQLKVYDVNSNDLVSEVYSDPITGEYFVVLTEGQEYAIAINRPGYLFQNLAYDYLEKEGIEPERLDIQLDPIAVGAQTVLKNIFFKTNEYELQQKSEAQLATIIEFLKSNPRVAVEISGHTDSTGSDELNKELSINRARSVYDYLIDNEINEVRLSYAGYGSSLPVADNTSESGKALNRRIEFKIIRL